MLYKVNLIILVNRTWKWTKYWEKFKLNIAERLYTFSIWEQQSDLSNFLPLKTQTAVSFLVIPWIWMLSYEPYFCYKYIYVGFDENSYLLGLSARKSTIFFTLFGCSNTVSLGPSDLSEPRKTSFIYTVQLNWNIKPNYHCILHIR